MSVSGNNPGSQAFLGGANSGREQLQQKRPLFNHLVGAGEHSIWQGHTRRLCGF